MCRSDIIADSGVSTGECGEWPLYVSAGCKIRKFMKLTVRHRTDDDVVGRCALFCLLGIFDRLIDLGGFRHSFPQRGGRHDVEPVWCVASASIFGWSTTILANFQVRRAVLVVKWACLLRDHPYQKSCARGVGLFRSRCSPEIRNRSHGVVLQ